MNKKEFDEKIKQNDINLKKKVEQLNSEREYNDIEMAKSLLDGYKLEANSIYKYNNEMYYKIKKFKDYSIDFCYSDNKIVYWIGLKYEVEYLTSYFKPLLINNTSIGIFTYYPFFIGSDKVRELERIIKGE